MRKLHPINLLTVLLSVGIIFYLVLGIFYVYPRDIVEAPQSKTDKTEYKIGDPIFVSGHTKVSVNADSINNVFVSCGASEYVVQTFKLKMFKTEGDYPAFKMGVVPDGVLASPPYCKLVTRTTYRVPTILWFTREYEHTFETNDFTIIK
ncbi:MAG: hypothetical protein WCJ60_01685 [bacterium]